MDQLPADQQETIKKANTERLRVMAARTGAVDDEELATMDRRGLVEVVTQGIVDRNEAENMAASRKKSERSGNVRELELQLELKKIEMEAENRRMEAENERRRIELEIMKISHETGMTQERTDEDDLDYDMRRLYRRPRVEALADKVKRYGSALKQVVAPMSNDASDIPHFFESLEAMFRSFEVPDDLRGKLLLQFLSQKAKTLISRLSSEELDNYENVREYILSEFKLTPREYKARFDNVTKRTDETYIYFVARLRNGLRYYLRSRKCDEFETLCDLLIVDKLKSCLPPGPLNYVLSLEGDDWFAAKRVAELADTFVANRPVREPERARAVHSTQVVSGNRTDTWRDKRSPRNGQLQCYNCKGRGHTAYHCKRVGDSGNPPYRASNENRSSVKRCFRCHSTQHIARDCNAVIDPPNNNVHPSSIHHANDNNEVHNVHACLVSVPVAAPVSKNDNSSGQYNSCVEQDGVKYDVHTSSEYNAESSDDWPFSSFPSTECVDSVVSVNSSSVNLKIATVPMLQVDIHGIRCNAMCDSGAEVPLISEHLFTQLDTQACGHISMQGVIGQKMRIPLVNVIMKLSGDHPNAVNVEEGVQVVCGVAPLNTRDCDVIVAHCSGDVC